MKTARFVLALVSLPAALLAQDGTIIYRLGRDTVAVEQFTRTPTRFAGEMVLRSPAAVTRTQYELTLQNGRPTSAIIRRRQADGTPIANAPTETRFTFRADSAKREIVWRDSTQTASFAAPNAFPALPVYAYAPFELIYARGASRDSVLTIGQTGNAIGVIGLQQLGGDTLRMRGGAYPMIVRFDREGRLQSTDGFFTTNKAIGTRISNKVDIAAIAAAMKPTGALSPRGMAYAAFGRSPIFINYGRPAVRDRTVWGGTLVPFDTIWRTGANEATHLATSRSIVLGDMTLAPGLYTLWTQHTRNGTFLIVNKQVGQWGTEYQASQDIGRVKLDLARAPEPVEDFTITIRAASATRGFIDLAWGDSVATTSFTVRP
ncbi:MAG TPA: DUF2911 domain-containing protein [Gemmatimonadaceae bacterium]